MLFQKPDKGSQVAVAFGGEKVPLEAVCGTTGDWLAALQEPSATVLTVNDAGAAGRLTFATNDNKVTLRHFKDGETNSLWSGVFGLNDVRDGIKFVKGKLRPHEMLAD